MATATLMSTSSDTATETPSFTPRKMRGDRGNAYKRAKLIGNRTPKDMGIKRTFKKVPWFTAHCDHKDKRGRLNCKKGFGGLNLNIVMGNKALHEKWHEDQDRRAAEMAGVN